MSSRSAILLLVEPAISVPSISGLGIKSLRLTTMT